MLKRVVALLCLFAPGLAFAAPADQMMVFTGAVAFSNNTLFDGTANSNTINFVWEVVPFAATVKNLRVKTSATITAGSRTYTLFKNGSSTAVTCTITSGTTCADLTDTITVSAGDVLVLQDVAAVGTSAASKGSVELSGASVVPFIVMSTQTIVPTTGQFFSMNVSSTEASTQMPAPYAGTISNLYIINDNGGGVATTYSIRVNGSSTGTPTCSTSAGNCFDTTTTKSISAGDLLDIAVTGTSPGHRITASFTLQ
jgi:hypothetical protein